MRLPAIIACIFFFSCKQGAGDKAVAATGKELPEMDTVSSISSIYTNELKDSSLSLETIAVSGDLGQTTFTRNDSTLFYFRENKGGKIRLNGKEYALTRLSFDKKYGYMIAGENDLLIAATKVNFKENDGEDCGYGTIPELLIWLGNRSLTVFNIKVQDCPSY